MIIKMPFDESWEANDHLKFWIYSIQNPTSVNINCRSSNLSNFYYMLNKKRGYLLPENTVREQKDEDNEQATSFLKHLQEAYD